MVSPTGPTGLGLFLLCCAGAWLAVHTAPTRNSLCQEIVSELKGLSEELLKVQEDEVGLPASYQLPPLTPCCQLSFEVGLPASYQLPPLTPCCQLSCVNSSAILPYVKAIRPFVHGSTVIEDAIQQLVKIKVLCKQSPEVPVPAVPSNSFERKRFVSAVLRELSLCLESL